MSVPDVPPPQSAMWLFLTAQDTKQIAVVAECADEMNE